MFNPPNVLRRFAVRTVSAWLVSFALCAAGFAQQITCPEAASTTNTSVKASNAMNPCQIQSGVTFTNDSTGHLTNFAGAVLVNDGTLANNGDFFNLAGATLTNAGTFNGTGQVQNSGTINNVGAGTLTNKVIDNNVGGVINIDPGATLFNADVLNNAGAINNNAGQVTLLSGTLNNNSGGTLTNSGAFQINGGATLKSDGGITNISGSTFTNDGTLNTGLFNNYGAVTNGSGAMISTLSNTEFENHSGSTLSNYGKITNFGNFINDSGGSLTTYGEILNAEFLSNAGSLEVKSGGSIFNEPGTSITNTGNLLIDSGGNVTSYGVGTDVLNVGTIINNGTYEIEKGAGLTNAGTFTLNAGAELLSELGGQITNAGTMDIRAGATLTNQEIGDPYLQTHGQTIVDGTLNSAMPLQIQGGVLSGTGKIVGSVINVGGTVQPGDTGAPGVLLMEGYEQQSGATFDELIGAKGNGELVAVPGGILLDPGALLDIDLLNGFTPTDGETFDIMGAIGITGTFANAPTTGFQMDGFDWTITYDPGEIILDAVSPVSSGGGGGNTPEPSSLLLLSAALLALIVCSRMKRVCANA